LRTYGGTAFASQRRRRNASACGRAGDEQKDRDLFAGSPAGFPARYGHIELRNIGSGGFTAVRRSNVNLQSPCDFVRF
jgi:hypothetical protein